MKKIIIVVILIIFIILIFPEELQYTDGGTIAYKSLTYQITNYHAEDGMRGRKVEIFGVGVYDGTYFIDEQE